MLLGVLLQKLSAGPLNGQEVYSGVGLSNLDCPHHVGVQDSGTILRFAHKTRDSGTVMTQLFAKDFQGYSAVTGMNGFVNGRSTAFADLTLQGVPGYL